MLHLVGYTKKNTLMMHGPMNVKSHPHISKQISEKYFWHSIFKMKIRVIWDVMPCSMAELAASLPRR